MNLHFLMAETEHAAETIAAAEGQSGGIGSLFTALGLNAQLLVVNLVAFLLVAWILGKFAFPSLIKALDAKKDELEAAARQEREAAVKLEAASKQADQVVGEARQAADEILASAKADAAAQIDAARTKATEQGERLIAEAREQLSRDVLAARKELKAETAKLVADAAGMVLNQKLDGQADRDLIDRSLEGK
jgi:F-type H+-transporting ATPase subunit b